MLKLSKLLDTRRDSPDATSDLRLPLSPLTANSSAPVSPALSLFSARGHTRLSSSTSSLVSSPGLANSMECSSKSQLTDVREETWGETRHLEDDYFQHFDQGMSVTDDSYFPPSADYDGYDLADGTGIDVAHSPKKRRSDRSDSVSAKGISRISSRISTMSNRWRPKRTSDDLAREEPFPDELRSRTGSVSSARVSPNGSPLSPRNPPSPARAVFEERLSESGVRPIDIDQANRRSIEDDSAPQATTPLLPPFMGEGPPSLTSTIHSPLQSPSVADVTTDDFLEDNDGSDSRTVYVPSPPLSKKPSIASFNRPRTNTMRSISGDAPPFVLSDPNDEWAHKLGHANFTIQPEPYVPEVCEIESFQQLRTDWDLARCNFAKHLVRTGEHYGITSNIYKLTEEKWEANNKEWKQIHYTMLSQLEASGAAILSLTKSSIHPCEQIKLPRLHDNAKFPELGDEEIVGPMVVAPASTLRGPCRTRSLKKRNFFRFFQDLVTRS
ncbi:hypothetical protein ASPZODRAFT_63767 [Penicilliopsis zonata CBS 506.65]|uniref:Only prolin and serin are matching in the corresponding protein n=1 Tax=Penicilliopsis zonata CBS 506.65 TaxID=1073090 RepID=A0A1L9SJX5_9EURO|nr:hypothetical protein ASPZODRAFT_63767 [Penicilliopsis zonata CBS 506.65]OJJ47467.1 hypothetical protein ASPZODRAFT_63767 [Penicilliopsis zonata CBS 506.65]